MCLRCLYAAVEHAQEDGRVLVQLHHEALLFLHLLLEGFLVNSVRVVEEQVAIADQLYLHNVSRQ